MLWLFAANKVVYIYIYIYIYNKLCGRPLNLPAPVRRTLRPSSSPYTPYACSAQRALIPVAVAMNIYDVRDI